jgi:hypothetical protein
MTDRDLTGIAGTHFVTAELSRREWIALPTVRNTKGIDILAYKNDKSIQIQVKTRANSKSFTLTKSAEKLISDNVFYVFVDLNGLAAPEYFIIPSNTVAQYVTETHQLFLDAGGKDSNIRKLPNKYRELNLEDYKDWNLLK